ncbi:Tdh Threonine dehydrogenase and related Zn-dependent dehydrogenases [Fimbriimonadaceae bacterium]
MQKSRALLFTAVDVVELAEVQIPHPEVGEVLVRTDFTCISPGTELRCFAGLQPGLDGWGYIPGYAAVSTIVEASESAIAKGCVPDTKVIGGGTLRASVPRSWGGHTEYAVLSADSCIPLQDGDDLVAASAARLAGIAYRGVRYAQVLPNERVAVLGLGAVGQCSARLFHATGATVVAIDPVEQRRAHAAAEGIETVDPEMAGKELINSFDVVVDATGSERATALTIALAKGHPWDRAETNPARIIVQGSYPGLVSFPYQATFEKELSVRFPRNVVRQDMEAVMDLHRRGRINLRSIVSDVLSPSDAQSAYDRLKTRPGEITFAFDWR